MEQNRDRIVVQVNPDIEELIPEFLQRRHTDIAAISDALKKGDYETIRILGHSMKGSGGGYGFDAISDIGRRLEQVSIRKRYISRQKRCQTILNDWKLPMISQPSRAWRCLPINNRQSINITHTAGTACVE